MWFIGVEVAQETSAPPPKKNPGSAPVNRVKLFVFIVENVDIDFILPPKFSIIFHTNRELNACIIKFQQHFLGRFFDPLGVFFLWIQIANMAPSKTLIIVIFYVNQSFGRISELLR